MCRARRGSDRRWLQGVAEFRLPVGRGTRLYLSARDVIHSFWVPEFRQKQDAVPGITTQITITPTKTGSYRLICTEPAARPR